MSVRLFSGVSATEATTSLAVNISALRCPSAHRNCVAVKDLYGECVAALCPDCDQQLPATWAPAPPGDCRAEHEKDHHGHPAVFKFACRLCVEECQ